MGHEAEDVPVMAQIKGRTMKARMMPAVSRPRPWGTLKQRQPTQGLPQGRLDIVGHKGGKDKHAPHA